MKLSGSILVCCSVVSLAATAMAAGDRDPTQQGRRDARAATSMARIRTEISSPVSVVRPATSQVASPLRAKSPTGLSHARLAAPVIAAQSGMAPAAHIVPLPSATRLQRALTNGGAIHIGRTPSIDRAGTARLNRFVPRRSDPAQATVSSEVARSEGMVMIAGARDRD